MEVWEIYLSPIFVQSQAVCFPLLPVFVLSSANLSTLTQCCFGQQAAVFSKITLPAQHQMTDRQSQRLAVEHHGGFSSCTDRCFPKRSVETKNRAKRRVSIHQVAKWMLMLFWIWIWISLPYRLKRWWYCMSMFSLLPVANKLNYCWFKSQLFNRLSRLGAVSSTDFWFLTNWSDSSHPFDIQLN